jgi:excisionase family DNA binding protein
LTPRPDALDSEAPTTGVTFVKRSPWVPGLQMVRKILTVSELAEHLSVHRITIYRLLKDGTLPGFKIGRVWRFDLDEIANWMASGNAAKELAASPEEGAPQDLQPDGMEPRAVRFLRTSTKGRTRSPNRY